MVRVLFLSTVLALFASVNAQCGAGTPNAKVTGSSGAYVATNGSRQVYAGGDYRAACQAALDSITTGQRVSVIASGAIGANTITVGSGKTFEVCGTIDVG